VTCSFCISISLVTDVVGSCGPRISRILVGNFVICLHCCTFFSLNATVVKSHSSENPKTYNSLYFQKTKILAFPKILLGGIQQAVSVHQLRTKPLESVGVSSVYGVHEVTYHTV